MTYKGLYFVLAGHLKPLKGIVLKAIAMDQLIARL